MHVAQLLVASKLTCQGVGSWKILEVAWGEHLELQLSEQSLKFLRQRWVTWNWLNQHNNWSLDPLKLPPWLLRTLAAFQSTRSQGFSHANFGCHRSERALNVWKRRETFYLGIIGKLIQHLGTCNYSPKIARIVWAYRKLFRALLEHNHTLSTSIKVINFDILPVSKYLWFHSTVSSDFISKGRIKMWDLIKLLKNIHSTRPRSRPSPMAMKCDLKWLMKLIIIAINFFRPPPRRRSLTPPFH